MLQEKRTHFLVQCQSTASETGICISVNHFVKTNVKMLGWQGPHLK